MVVDQSDMQGDVAHCFGQMGEAAERIRVELSGDFDDSDTDEERVLNKFYPLFLSVSKYLCRPLLPAAR